jgi:HEAT repeat protein
MSNLNHPLIPEILAQALYHPFRDVSEISAYFLARLYDDKRAAPVIKEMLLGENVLARTNAAEVAYKVWDADIVKALISNLLDTRIGQRFNGKRVSVAEIASEALSYIATPETLAAVDQYVTGNISNGLHSKGINPKS